MNCHESRKTGLLRLRHLFETTEAKGEEMNEQRERFERLADPQSKPVVVSSFNLFQTPEPIAERMAQALAHQRRSIGRTLEPSAGLGRLYRAVRALKQHDICITLVDNSRECCGQLYRLTDGVHGTERDASSKLICADFLTTTIQTPGTSWLGMYDSIIMNPPFKNGTDIQHILHARQFLTRGGRLVALCANGPRQRLKLLPIATTWDPLPSDSFATEGTHVNVAMLTIDRP